MPIKMFDEFKQFIARGNVVDLAVGIVVGAAFTGIVNSLVSDIVNPIIGIFLGGLDFSEYYLNLSLDKHYDTLDAAMKAGAPVIKYGLFLNAVIKFLIIAFVVFLMVKQFNKLKTKMTKEEAAKPTATPEDVLLLREIRDSLKK